MPEPAGATRHINPDGLMASPAFSQMVVVEPGARLLFVGGQNGVHADGTLAAADLAGQVRQIMRNLRTALAAAGADLADVVTWDVRVVQGQDGHAGFAAFQEAWGERTDRRPPSPSPSSPASPCPARSPRSPPSPPYPPTASRPAAAITPASTRLRERRPSAGDSRVHRRRRRRRFDNALGGASFPPPRDGAPLVNRPPGGHGS